MASNPSPFASVSASLSGSQAAGGVLKVTNTHSAPTNANLQVIDQASGDLSFGTEVTADANFRYTVDSNGLTKWGPGNAAADTGIQRGGKGLLQLSTDQSAGTFKSLDGYAGGFGYFQRASVLGTPNCVRTNYTNATAGVTTSGTVYLVAYYLPAGTTVTNIVAFTGTGTLKTGGTHGWYVLCDSGRVVRSVSADQTDAATIWGTASTEYSLAVSPQGGGQFVTTYSGLYYLGIMVANSAGTQPNLVAGANMTTGVAGLAPIISGPSGTVGQTTPPTADGSVTISAIGSPDGTKNFMMWVT